jgi:type IV secretory pathway component VirB8
METALTLMAFGVLFAVTIMIMLTADKRDEYVIDYDEERNG